MDLGVFSDILKVLLQIANVVVLGYALFRFMKKPHDSLETRIISIEERLEKVEQSQTRRDEKISKVSETNEVLIHSVLALIEFEIQYCLTEHKDMSKDLEKAKEDLHSYLARK